MSTVPLNSGYPFSLRSYIGDGTTQNYAVDFPYLDTAHVKVYLDGTPQTAGFSFLTAGTLRFDAAPAVAAAILIRRETPVIDPLVVYTDPSTLKGANLNRNARQALYILQEQSDLLLGDIPVLDDVAQALADALQAVVDATAQKTLAQTARTGAEAAQTAAAASQAAVDATLATLRFSYDIVCSVPYRPTTGEVLGVHTMTRAGTIPAGALSSLIGTDTAGTADLTVTIKVDGVTIGTATITAGSTLGGLSIASPVALVPGSVVTFVAPTADINHPPIHSTTLRVTLT